MRVVMTTRQGVIARGYHKVADCVGRRQIQGFRANPYVYIAICEESSITNAINAINATTVRTDSVLNTSIGKVVMTMTVHERTDDVRFVDLEASFLEQERSHFHLA